MSDLKLAWIYLKSRPLVTLLTILSVSLGLALATMVLLLSRQANETLEKETAYWDVIIGAKGSPLQLVMNGLYYLDSPTGNISEAYYEQLKQDPSVKRVVPVNMGDTYFGVPIVGTTTDLFADQSLAQGGKLIAQGREFQKPFEVVVGADIAARRRLQLGDQIVGSHGWSRGGDAHPEFPYTVVGILGRTGMSMDRAIFADYHSVWEVHAHHDEHEGAGHAEGGITREEADRIPPLEATAADAHAAEAQKEVTLLLVQFNQAARRFTFVDDVNKHWQAMAVVPVEQIARLLQMFIMPLQNILLIVAYLVVLVSAFTILISLYLTIYQRRKDIAILRSLGATQTDIFRLVTVEAAVVAGFGVVVGWLLGHLAIALAAPSVLDRYGVALYAWQFHRLEGTIGISVWVLGILAGLLPALVAYRLPVAETYAKE